MHYSLLYLSDLTFWIVRVSSLGDCFHSFFPERTEPEAMPTDFDGFSTFSPCRVSFPTGSQLDTSDEIIVDDDDADVGVEVKSEPMDCSESLNRLSPTIGRIVLPDDNVGAMTFVDDAVKQLGFKTEMEEVQPGVFYPLAQKCLFVVKTLEKSF